MKREFGWTRGDTRASVLPVLATVLFMTQEAVSKIVINEFMASNSSTTTTQDGEYADWIELYNTSVVTENIGGWYLSDNFSTPTKWRIPDGTVIPPLGHVLIWANDTNPPNPARPLYASFRLGGGNGERIGLYRSDGVTTESFVVFGPQAADVSYGRILDDFPNMVPFVNGTPGRSNQGYVQPPESLQGLLYINEFMARNRDTINDNEGKSEDWVEIYSIADVPIDLGSLFLTDSTTTPTKFFIPYSNVVGSHGFILFWCDDDEEDGLNHTSFNLSGNGEQIGLYAQDGITPIDLLSFGPQTPDISRGRWPDGTPDFRFLSQPSPRESNVARSTRAQRWELYR